MATTYYEIRIETVWGPPILKDVDANYVAALRKLVAAKSDGLKVFLTKIVREN